MEIRAALSQLDEFNDDHWTGDGMPKTDKVSELVGQKITRKQILDAAPHFTRNNLDLGDGEENEEEEELQPEEVTGEGYVLQSETYLEFIQECRKIPKDCLEIAEKEIKSRADALEIEAKRLVAQANEIRRFIGPIRDRIRFEYPNGTNQQAIKDYIESQKRMRAERAVMGRLAPIDESLRMRHNPRPRMK